MAGIYLHWPFCAQRCIYCDFHSSVAVQHKQEMMHAMLCELELRASYLGAETIYTIYFGGGTPSLLSLEELNLFLQQIKQLYQLAEDAEITLESNPDDLSFDYLKGLKQIGFNRLSIGVQSFNEDELVKLKRRHTAQQALQVITWAKEAGFDNISIDLIYGLPQSTLNSWNNSLQQALNLGVKHLSAYHLTYETNTWLNKNKHLQPWIPLEEDFSLEQFSLLIEQTQSNGYEHYEISNFAKAACYSSHNLSYWKGKNYLGIGPSAHSFNGNSRQWNISHNNKYIQRLASREAYFEMEILSLNDLHNEFVFTALRTIWGINLDDFLGKFGTTLLDNLLKQSKHYLQRGLLAINNQQLIITAEGKMIADQIMSDLMMI